MHRRHLLSGLSGLGALTGLSGLATPAWSAVETSPLRTAALTAWIFGLPMIENSVYRSRVAANGGFGGFVHQRAPTTPATQRVTTPNNDTLNSRTWIDLSAGPATLTLPTTGSRYLSVALMDMFTNNFAVLGTRTTGREGATVTLVGPGQATSDPLAIRAPTPWVFVFARLLVDGPGDLAAARALQDRLTIRATPPSAPPAPAVDRNAAWPEVFGGLSALLKENPALATDLAAFARMRPLGLRPTGGFDTSRFAPEQGAQIELGIADAKASLLASQRDAAKLIDGWVYPKADLGDFGQDYFYRAQTALGGLYALPSVEAMYMRAVPETGAAFPASQSLRLHFPKGGLPPVDGFWSLTLYKATDQGQFFLFDNPIDRYSIGDRTPGIRYGADGSLDLWIGRTDPGGGRSANWLPSPPEGAYSLTLRAYLPQSALADGRYTLPPLQPVG